MKNHNGGFGMYYHFDYHGEPISYEWVNSTYLPEVWEQMTTTYEHGVRDIWIVNVGDLGLNELPLQYFLSLAYDYDKWGITNPNSTSEFTETMLDLQFAGAFAEDDMNLLRSLYTRYTRLIHNRRPEHLNEYIYHPQNYYEASLVQREAEDLYTICKRLLDKCPAEYKDSFIELIAYNCMGAMNLISLWINRGYNHYFASIGSVAANKYAELVKKNLRIDDELREMFNKAANGKWSGFADAEHIGFKHWNSEDAAYPILENVIPVKRPEIVVGLMGEVGETSGQEWSGKTLEVSNYLVKNVRSLRTKVFIALKGDREVPFTIEKNSDYIRFEKPSKVSLSDPIVYLDIELDKKSWDSSENPYLIVRYELGEIKVVFKPQNDDIYFCNADAFTAEYATLKGEMQVIRGIGRRESGVKILPVTNTILDPKDCPSLDYEFEIKNAGNYKLMFQMLPTNPYTFGKDIWMAYAVNPGEGISTEHTTFVKKVINGSEYKPGVSKDWWEGVLSHVRYVEADIFLHEGTNIIRYFPLSRENVLERLILVRAGVELPDSYLGPIM